MVGGALWPTVLIDVLHITMLIVSCGRARSCYSLPLPFVSVSVPLTDFSFWPRFGLVVRGVWIIGEKGEEWGAWISQLLPTRGSSTNAIQTGKNTSWTKGNSRWPGIARTQQNEQRTLYYLDRENTYLLIKRLHDSLNGNIHSMFCMFSVQYVFFSFH